LLEDIINDIEGKASGFALQVLRHDNKVLETVKEMSDRDDEGTYETFVEERIPRQYRSYIGHYTREYDIRRKDKKGLPTDVFEVKTNHTAKGYVKAVQQLSYAHLMHDGKIDTWYVSWSKDDGSRVVRPVWRQEHWEGHKPLSELYCKKKNRELYNYANTI